MPHLLDDASLPTDIPGLEAEIADAEDRMEACRKKIKALMDAERPAEGLFFAEEIHELKQRQMMLRYQKDLRVARANRLRLKE